MKYFRIILLIGLVYNVTIGYGQKDTLFLDKIYHDPVNLIVSQKVLVFDSLSKNELIHRFENWGGQFFRNYSEVQTSKTESQITLLYTSSKFFLTMYVIVVVEFKDGKMKLTFKDDGNVYRAGYYIGSTYHEPIESRTRFVRTYFDDGMITYRSSILNNPVMYSLSKAGDVMDYKANIDSTISTINEFMQKSSIELNKSDW
jgi:hypothetical protein